MTNTTNLGLPLMAAAQSQKHVTHNAAILDLDTLVQLAVISTTLTAPPGSPSDGDRYLPASGATGAWAGKDFNVAYYSAGAWLFLAPKSGWQCWDITNSQMLVYMSGAWTAGTVSGAALSGGLLTAKFKDANFSLLDDGDVTKVAQFQLSGFTTGTTRTFVLPNVSDTIAVLGLNQSFSGQTLTFGSNALASSIGIGTGANATGISKSVNIGTSGASGSTTSISIGPSLAGALGTLTIGIPTITLDSTVTALNGSAAITTLSQLGLGGASPSSTNRLSINSPAALFNNAGTSISLTLNKNATANDASFTFQTAFSTRALFGLLAVDDFIVKLTPDGSNFYGGVRGWSALHGRTDIKDANRKVFASWYPQMGGAGASNFIGLAATLTGTAAAVAPTTSNLYTQSPRNTYATAASAGASAGLVAAAAPVWRGNSGGLGGFYVQMRFGIETFQANSRMFVGLTSSTAVIGNVNPSTLLNIVGVGFDSADATLQLYTNDGSGTATKTSLGASFGTTGGQTLFELILSAEPNGSDIHYRVENLNGGNVVTGTISTDLPVNTTFLAPQAWYNNGTSAGSAVMGFLGLYMEYATMLGSQGVL